MAEGFVDSFRTELIAVRGRAGVSRRGVLGLLVLLVAGGMVSSAQARGPALNGLIAFSDLRDDGGAPPFSYRAFSVSLGSGSPLRIPCANSPRRGVCDDFTPLFSPNGRRLALYGRRSLVVQSPMGRPRRRYEVRLPDGGAAWSPDSRRLAIARLDRQGEVWILDVATGRLSRGPAVGNVQQIAWSPGGMQLAVSRVTAPQEGRVRQDTPQEVLRVPLEGGSAIRVARDPQFVETLSWPGPDRLLWVSSPGNYNRGGLLKAVSPRTRKVAFRVRDAFRVRRSPGGERLLYGCLQGACIADSRGKRKSVLSRRCQPLTGPLEWSPDGRHILCATERSLLLLDRRGKVRRLLVRGREVFNASWQARLGR